MTAVVLPRSRRRLDRLIRDWSGPPTAPIRPAKRRLRPDTGRVAEFCAARPRFTIAAALLLAAVAGLVSAGPVAGAIAAVYSGLAVAGWARRRTARFAERHRVAALDAVVTLAAEMRAGAGTTQQPALRAAVPAVEHNSTAAVALSAAWQVSELTGAPLADVLDRVEAHLRTQHRIRQIAVAHTAGAKATALLLAALPLGGIGLGAVIGADPAHQLLHTPLGAACAGLSLLLQVAGLLWTGRLSKVDRP
jgi:tight adherence protein B